MSRIPPQTTKQAKAAHKARNGSGLSDAQRRHIGRDSLIHRRAWAIQERERGNSIAAQKRTERIQRERAALSDASRFATQTRVDRYGHKSSQKHLRAFFTTCQQDTKGSTADLVSGGDDNLDSDLGDDVLLSGFKTNDARTKSPPEVFQASHTAINEQQQSPHDPAAAYTDSNREEIPWDNFESSTQIAKELADHSPTSDCTNSMKLDKHSHDILTSSLGLTTQEVERLDPRNRDSSPSAHALCVADPSTRRATSVLPNPPSPSSPTARSRPNERCQLTDMNDVFDGISYTQLEACWDVDLILTQA